MSPEDRKQGLALLDDELTLNALPRPVSLVGSHAYKVIDIPEGRRDFEQDFDLAVHPGRTVTVRVVDPSKVPIAPGCDGLRSGEHRGWWATNAFAATGRSRSTSSIPAWPPSGTLPPD